MSKLHNDLSRYNLVLNQFLVEEADKLNKENTESKITPEELIKKIMILQPAQVLSFITKQMGEKTGAELILKNSPSLAASILKHGFYKAKDLGKSIKDFGKKNIEDNSKIDFENVEIDTDTLKTIYVFDGDSIQKLEEFIKQYQESMKDIDAEATKAGEKLKSDVQAKKVKVSDETLDNNGLTVAGIIKNPENKNKSGKELTKEINQRVELENEIADSMKTTQEQLKKLDKLNLPELSEKDIEAAFKNIDSTDNKASDDSDDYNKRYEEIHKIEETITKSIKNKLGKDYQSSLDVKIYPTAVFKKSIEQKIPKIVIDAIKARYTLGVRIDFFGDESDTVLEADEEGRYVVKLVKDDEKNPDIKKIVDTFKNLIKSNVDSKDIEGKVYAYLKYWKGENPDANFDSLFIFMGFTKFNVKESLGESNMINEADTTPDFEELSQAMSIVIAKMYLHNKNYISQATAYKEYEKWLYATLDKLDELDSEEREKIREQAQLVFEHAITDPKQAIEDFSISKQALEIADKMSSFDPTDGEIGIESYSNDAVNFAINKIKAGVDGEIQELMQDLTTDGMNPAGSASSFTDLSLKSLKVDDKTFYKIFNVTKVIDHDIIKRDVREWIGDYMNNYQEDPVAAAKELLNVGKNKEQKELLAEIACKIFPDAKDEFKNLGISVDGVIDGDAIADKAVKATNRIEKLTSEIRVNDNGVAVGSYDRIAVNSYKSLGLSEKDFYKMLGAKNVSNRAPLLRKFAKDLQKFETAYHKDGDDKSVETLLKLAKTKEQKELFAEVACKMHPELADEFKAQGININGVITGDDVADAVADAADNVANTAGKIEKLNDIKQNGGNFKVKFTLEDRSNPKIFPPDDNGFNPMRELRELKSPRMEPSGVANQLKWFKNHPDSESARSRLLQSLTKQDEQIKKWNTWIDTLSEEDLENPKTRANIAMMKRIEEEYNKLKETATSALKSAEIEDSTEYISDSVNTEDVDKESIAELSNNEETKEMTKGFLGKIGSGLKSFMNVIAVAKIAKFVLNHGKTFTDVLGAQVVKFKEDKNIIAEVTCILNNEEGSDSNYSDTKFSVRFDVNDLKWHATNLDNRKMKITNEEALIKKIMEVQEVKDFKKQCLDAWSKIFDVKTKQDAIIPYFLRNYEKLGMKINDKNMKKYIESLVKVADNFETIKKQFEGN